MKTQIDMSEINKISHNGYNVVSLFSGAGGSSLGYKLAGFKVLLANEFIKYAQEVYEFNHKGTILLKDDIRTIKGNDILNKIGLAKYELDILDGSPPCSSFSVNGKREKGWGKINNYSTTKQQTDDLFFEYARILKDIMPKVFIAENVKGLTMGKAKQKLAEIIKCLSEIGYNVQCKVLDASDYNVPQKRERLIILGVRNDLNMSPVFPIKCCIKMSCREAIEDLMDEESDQVNKSKREELIKEYFHQGCGNKEIRKICKENGLKVYEQSFRRDKWEEPYYTIKQHHTRPFHPRKDRLLSIKEGMRLQTFPDDFILLHSPTQNWERIGRAVPPNLMKAIASTIKNEVLDKI